MKLYLSSIRVPAPEGLQELLGKPFDDTKLALIPNAKDYYAKRAWEYKVNDCAKSFEALGIKVDVVDLRDYDDANKLRQFLAPYDVIWAMGGNTFCLRYEMRRSGFEQIIKELLEDGKIYGGDSAGALVAGPLIGGIGIELADEPAFAEKIITEGLGLIPYIVMPHVDNPEFAEVMSVVRELPIAKDIIELKDSQAVIFTNDERRIVEGQKIVSIA